MSVGLSNKNRGGSLRPGAELDPDLVAHFLEPLFPDLTLPHASEPEIKIGTRIGWFETTLELKAGKHGGVRSVFTESWPLRNWYEAIDEHRSQLATLLISPLLGLAHVSGRRLLVDEDGLDVTEGEPAEIAELLLQSPRTWPQATATGRAATAEAALDDDAYLEQFLDAAGPRLQWLREQSAQTD